jgi:competence transcription factor ComK
MKVELTLLELNDLYYAASKFMEQAKEDATTYKGEFFTKQYERATELTTKLQDALYEEAKKIDEAIDYIRAKHKEYAEENEKG